MHSQSQGETIRFRIPGDPKYVSIIRRAIQSIASNLEFPDELTQDIEMSVAEALANAVEHGSPERNGNAVMVSCRVSNDSLTIDIRDEGPGVGEESPEKESGSLEEHGRGLQMIYKLMDKVDICRTPKGSRIHMVKKTERRTSNVQHQTSK